MKLRMTRAGQSLVATLSVAGLAIGYLHCVFLPKQTAIAELQGELESRRTYLSQSQGIADTLRQSVDALQETRKYVHDWRSRAPLESKIGWLYAEIEGLGNSAGISVARFAPQPVVHHQAIWHVPVQIGARGTYQQIFEFVRELELLDSTVLIESMRIENAGDRDARPGEGLGTDLPAAREAGKLLRLELSLVVFAGYTDFSEQ